MPSLSLLVSHQLYNFVFVVAKNDQNKICTLGRGGSDFTAALLGVSLVAREIQIWTDTDGVLTGDPRIVDEPLHIEHMAFEEGKWLLYNYIENTVLKH